MSKNNIDIRLLQTFQTAFQPFDDVLLRKTPYYHLLVSTQMNNPYDKRIKEIRSWDTLSGKRKREQVPSIWLLPASAKEYLRDEHIFVARPSKLFESLTHLNLTLAVGIDLSRIERVYAILPSGLEAILHHAAFLRLAIR